MTLHVHLDAVGGISGDMFVAAMLDARPDLQARVFEDLAAVLPPHAGHPRLDAGLSGGIAAMRFGLDAGARAHGAHEGHGARFADLLQRIAQVPLQAGTAAQASAILRRLAEVESRMHGVPVDEVHFHEIGDWDSLLDVVAAGSLVAALAGAHWSVSALPRGEGLVRTQHGLLPVPAPATVALLQGFRWRDDGIGGERVTPTGAAILAHVIDRPAPPDQCGLLAASGTGAGTREMPGLPNVLRALCFTVHAPGDRLSDEVAVLEFDVDDMSGEEVGVAIEHLRALDAVIDLSLGARQGKKGRPLHDLRLLVRPDGLDAVIERCFVETATLGLRWRREARVLLPRTADEVAVGGHRLRRKQAQRPGGEITHKVESDDVVAVPGLAARRRLRQSGENG